MLKRMKKSLFYLIPKIIGIILVAPFAILVHVIAGTWEAIMAIYEAIREVYQVYTGELPDIDDHHEWSSCAWCGDKNAEHINGRCQTCVKRDKECKHMYEPTDTQGYDMECSVCGKLWRLY